MAESRETPSALPETASPSPPAAGHCGVPPPRPHPPWKTPVPLVQASSQSSAPGRGLCLSLQLQQTRCAAQLCSWDNRAPRARVAGLTRSARDGGQGRCQSVRREPHSPLSKGHARIPSSWVNSVPRAPGLWRSRAVRTGSGTAIGAEGPHEAEPTRGLLRENLHTHLRRRPCCLGATNHGNHRGGRRVLCPSSVCAWVTEPPSPQSGA